MKIKPTHFTDKFGRDVILRHSVVEDARNTLEYLRVVDKETPYLLLDDEADIRTLEDEGHYIYEYLLSPRKLLLVAEVEGAYAGNCCFDPAGICRKCNHRCDIGIALYKKYCGAGIGQKLLETALDIAKSVGYSQAELRVLVSNSVAISLYEKLGFEKHGVISDAVEHDNGIYEDLLYMIKKL